MENYTFGNVTENSLDSQNVIPTGFSAEFTVFLDSGSVILEESGT